MRCNVGVIPRLLVDYHLNAEMMEIPMVLGSLRYWGYQIKSDIPPAFKLGPGHMNFLKTKLVYLKRRHDEVYKEVLRRGFKNNKSRVDLDDIPEQFLGDWNPTLEDSKRLRIRLHQRLMAKANNFWKYERRKLTQDELIEVVNKIDSSELFYV